jgi:hypothetical protein
LVADVVDACDGIKSLVDSLDLSLVLLVRWNLGRVLAMGADGVVGGKFHILVVADLDGEISIFI